MDQKLRSLFQVFQQTGDPVDAIAYYRHAVRIGHPVHLEELQPLRPILGSPSFQAIGLHHAYFQGEALQETVIRLFNSIPQPHNLNSAMGLYGAAPREFLFALLCTSGRGLYIYCYTLARHLRRCTYCYRREAHVCDRFVHPHRTGMQLKPRLDVEELEDPILAHFAEADPEIERRWAPKSLGRPRQMGESHDYIIESWEFYYHHPDGVEGHPQGWDLRQTLLCSRFIDPKSPKEVREKSIYEWGVEAITRRHGEGAAACVPIFDAIDRLIPPYPHEPIEEPPVLVIGPCPNFEIDPDGEVVSIIDETNGRVDGILDLTTRCGHGYIKETMMPLCPPMWSDGVQAGWHCNTCGKVLGLNAASSIHQPVMCRACQVVNQWKQDEKYGGPKRIKEEIFRCSCGNKFSSLEEASACCGEDESNIRVSTKWDWSFRKNPKSKLPKFLYHATYQPILDSLKQHGIGAEAPNKIRAWPFSKPETTYLASSKGEAESYAEISEEVPEDWIDQIVVLKIPTKLLNIEHLKADANLILEEDGPITCFEYDLIIPWSDKIKVLAWGTKERKNPSYQATLFHGTPHQETITQFSLQPEKRNSRFEAASLGIWFTDDFRVASSFAFKTVKEYLPRFDPKINDYLRWSDGELQQFAQYSLVAGKVYTCSVSLQNPKVYISDSDPDGPDSLELMMNDRDQFAAYINCRRGEVPAGYWRKKYIAVDSEETNRLFREYLIAQGYDGIVLTGTRWDAIGKAAHTQVCAFSPEQIKILSEQEPDARSGEINYY